LKKSFLYCPVLVLLVFLSLTPAYSQLTVTPGNSITLTPQQFVETYLVGAGVTVSNATFNGSSAPINIIQTVGGSTENLQIGNFTSTGTTTSEITFTGGVIMSSGNVSSAVNPPNFASTDTHGPTGDPDLAKIANVSSGNVKNQAILEFDFIPQTDAMNFRYEFASEEFDTYCSGYNDAFGFFLSGPGIAGGMGYVNDAVNIAILPNSTLPVTISNVCANKPEYSWWNVPEKDLSYNRFTHVFVASYGVTCLQTYHIKLAICDVTDGIYDSGVFLEMNSFSSTAIQANTTFSNPLSGSNSIEGCSNAIIVFSIANAQASDYVIDLAVNPASTASQTDVLPNPLPTSWIIPAGSTTSTPLVIQPLEDGVPEGDEALILNASHTVCAITSTVSVNMMIKEKPPLVVTMNPAPPGIICDNTAVTLSANVTGGYPGYSYLWPGGLTTNPADVTALFASPNITLRVADVCGDTTYGNISLAITPLPAAPGVISGQSNICKPSNGIAYHIDAIPWATGYAWKPPTGVVSPPNPSPNDITLDYGIASTSGNLEVNAVNQCGDGPSALLPITVYDRPVPVIQASLTSACVGIPVTYTTEAGMNGYQWTWPAANASLVSGGTNTDNTLTLNWTVAGAATVSVNYSDANNCSAISPTTLSVNVSGLPTPTISGSQGLCVGTTGTAYTTETGMSNYSWTVSPGNTVVSSGNSCTVDWLVAGPQWIKVVYQDPLSGCSSSPANPGLAVTVHALPVPTIAGTGAGCQDISLGPFTTESGKTGYVWNTDGGTLVQGAGPHEVFVTWATPGVKQLTVSYTDANSCTGTSASHPVTVSPTPVVAFASPATPYCPNTPAFVLNFGSPAGGIYSGAGVTNVSGTYYFDPALASVGPNTINYSYTSAAGCQAPASGTISINPLPDVLFTPAHSNLRWCSADPVNISLGSAIPGSTFTWTSSANAAAINPSSITNGAGEISQAFTNSGSIQEAVQFQVSATAGGCTSSPYPYTVQVNPVASITANPSAQVICSETSTQAVAFNLVPASGTSVSWTFTSSANMLPATGSGTSNPVPASAFTNTGTAQETLSWSVATSYDNCPGNSIQYNILVNPKPALANNPMSQNVCLGGTSSRVDFVPNVTYPVSYSWQATPSPASISGYTAGTQTTAFILPQTLTDPSNSAGTVTYSITPSITLSSLSCSGSVANYVINTNPLPTPNIQTVQSVCEQSSGVVYSTANSVNHSYQWSISGGTITSSALASSVTVDWGTAGPASLSVTESVSGSNPVCLNTDTKTLTLLPRPVPTITSSHSLAGGICLQQTGLYQTQPGMSNYSWSVTPGGSIVSQNNQNITVSWNTAGPARVSVNYNAANGCNALAPSNINFNVNPLPDVTISGPVPAVACQGNGSAFSVPADPNSAFTWSLSPSGAGNLTTPQGQATANYSWVTPSNNVAVSVGGLTIHGCTATSQVLLDVHPSPAVSLAPCYDPVTIPTARPFTLRGGIPSGSGGVYSGEGISLSGGQYVFNPASVSGPFPKTVPITYTYANTFGCNSSDSRSIQVVSAPAFQCENSLMPLRDVRTSPNRSYNTFWRGNRCWMTQNLDYGSPAPSSQPQTDNCQPEKFCAASDPGCTLYGGFYQWDELMQFNSQPGEQGLCPPGWHIPTLNEWQMLIDDPLNLGNALAGGFLKDAPFTAGLEGIYYSNISWNFIQGGSLTASMFWTSTLSSQSRAWARGMNVYDPSVSLYSSGRQNALQVRCVKD